MRVSLIISFYKNIEYLELILLSLENQSSKEFEVIISDDDNCESSTCFVNSQIRRFSSSFEISHVHQAMDDGFRKNEVLNKAIIQSRGEIIIFIDGDCVPHEHFVREYSNSVKENTAFFGRRVMLSDSMTKMLLKTKTTNSLTFLKLLLSGSKKLKYAFFLPLFSRKKTIGIWGCNWGIHKKHLIEVNGYDEDYIMAGIGEDADVEWRLLKKGISFYSIRYQAIVFHLFHKPNYSDEYFRPNFDLLKQKKLSGVVFCMNGIKKDLTNT